MSIELTKDAEALVCVLYAEYLKRLKSGKQNPKDFSGTDEAADYTKNKFSFEETNEILNSLARKGFLFNTTHSCGIMVYATLTDDCIVYMENKGKRHIAEVLKTILGWSPAIAECVTCISTIMQ